MVSSVVVQLEAIQHHLKVNVYLLIFVKARLPRRRRVSQQTPPSNKARKVRYVALGEDEHLLARVCQAPPRAITRYKAYSTDITVHLTQELHRPCI